MSNQAITIIANTAVKAIVTSKLKEKTLTNLKRQEQELRDKIAQVDFQKQFYGQRLSEDSEQLQSVLQQLKQVEDDLEKQLHQSLERIAVAQKWENGQEILQTQVQTSVDLAVGDNFFEAYSKEIVLRDGVVIEIRHGGKNGDE